MTTKEQLFELVKTGLITELEYNPVIVPNAYKWPKIVTIYCWEGYDILWPLDIKEKSGYAKKRPHGKGTHYTIKAIDDFAITELKALGFKLINRKNRTLVK